MAYFIEKKAAPKRDGYRTSFLRLRTPIGFKGKDLFLQFEMSI
jgi:hypothetical protein